MKYFGREPIDRQKVALPRGSLFLIPDRCKGCGICIEFCPLKVLKKSSATNGKGYWLPEVAPGQEQQCVNCQFCSLVCPEFAIFSQEAPA